MSLFGFERGRFGIAQKINFLITVILLLLGTFMGLYFSRQQTKILTTGVEERIGVLLNSLAYSIEYPLLIDDRKSIGRIIRGMLVQKDVVGCAILNNRGETVYQARRQSVSGEIREFSTSVTVRKSAKTSEDLFFRRQEHGRNEVIGRIQLQVSMQALNERTADIKRTVALVVVAVIILGSAAVYLLLVFVLDLPVAALVEATRRISMGNLDYRVPVRSRDEIGQLAKSFDHMVGDLQKSMVSKDYMDKIIETMIDALIVLDMKGRIEQINRAAENLLGCSMAEVKGKPLSFLFDNEEDVLFGEQGLAALSAGEYVQNLEKVMVGKNHRPIPVLFSAAVMHNQNGTPIAVVCMALDITLRKEAERKLVLAVAELKRSNTELEQFAYVASHDLQEPLRTVSSYLQLLQRRYGNRLDSTADEFIRFAVEGSKRMQRLINDLLLYSRLQTRGNPFESTDCESIFEKAIANLGSTISENHATITHDPLPVVLGDALQLEQLFQNLIGNAIKYHGDQPPQVHVGVQFVLTIAGGTGSNEEWLFFVRDNGIGIAPEHHERIFQIFKRLHTREEYPGTGIGLALCKKIVERHGGRIWIESEVGKGSVFHFTIPVRARNFAEPIDRGVEKKL